MLAAFRTPQRDLHSRESEGRHLRRKIVKVGDNVPGLRRNAPAVPVGAPVEVRPPLDTSWFAVLGLAIV